MSEWQPIETAQEIEDNTVLGFIQDDYPTVESYIEVVYFSKNLGWCSSECVAMNATHWMPLPSPPPQESEDE